MSLFHDNFKPMLLSVKSKPFNDKNYIFEMKFDGMRALIFSSKTCFKIQSRNGRDMTYLFPELKAIQDFISSPVIFDGEIVSFDKGLPSFLKLQERIHLKDYEKIFFKSREEPVIFMVFDILYLGKSLLSFSLLERKKILNQFLDTDVFMKVLFIDEFGERLFSKVKSLNLEGIVAKEIHSSYEINTRSRNWIKIKNIKSCDFFVGGFLMKKSESVFSLLLGEMQNGKLFYVGNVSVSLKNEIFLLLHKSPKRRKSPFCNFSSNNVIYVVPKYVCEVEFLERGSDGKLRHPVFKKLNN